MIKFEEIFKSIKPVKMNEIEPDELVSGIEQWMKENNLTNLYSFTKNIDSVTAILQHRKDKKDESKPFVSKKTDEYMNEEFEEFQIAARSYTSSKILRRTYMLRQEELISSLTKMQKKLDDYRAFKSTHTDSEVMKEYLNEQLQDFAITESQMIPTTMIELETLSAAIRSNCEQLEQEKNTVVRTGVEVVKYFKEQKIEKE